MVEEWRVVSRNPRYEVSNQGRIRKVTTKRLKKYELNGNGYPSIRLGYGKAATGTRYNIHRLVAEVFLPNPDNYPVVNHIDGDKLNNCVDNLEWCSYAHNNKHAYDHGLKTPYQRRISNDDRKSIGIMRRDGVSVRDIAKLYGVTESCIYHLFNRGQIPA